LAGHLVDFKFGSIEELNLPIYSWADGLAGRWTLAGAIKLYESCAITTLKSMEDKDQTAILQSWLSNFFVCLDLMISTVPTNHIACTH
jgi:hypothetical protein